MTRKLILGVIIFVMVFAGGCAKKTKQEKIQEGLTEIAEAITESDNTNTGDLPSYKEFLELKSTGQGRVKQMLVRNSEYKPNEPIINPEPQKRELENKIVSNLNQTVNPISWYTKLDFIPESYEAKPYFNDDYLINVAAYSDYGRVKCEYQVDSATGMISTARFDFVDVKWEDWSTLSYLWLEFVLPENPNWWEEDMIVPKGVSNQAENSVEPISETPHDSYSIVGIYERIIEKDGKTNIEGWGFEEGGHFYYYVFLPDSGVVEEGTYSVADGKIKTTTTQSAYFTSDGRSKLVEDVIEGEPTSFTVDLSTLSLGEDGKKNYTRVDKPTEYPEYLETYVAN